MNITRAITYTIIVAFCAVSWVALARCAKAIAEGNPPLVWGSLASIN